MKGHDLEAFSAGHAAGTKACEAEREWLKAVIDYDEHHIKSLRAEVEMMRGAVKELKAELKFQERQTQNAMVIIEEHVKTISGTKAENYRLWDIIREYTSEFPPDPKWLANQIQQARLTLANLPEWLRKQAHFEGTDSKDYTGRQS